MGRLDQAPEGSPPTANDRSGPDWERAIEDLFDQVPYGLFTVDRARSVVRVNAIARELLLCDETQPSPQPLTCCDLVCSRVIAANHHSDHCLTREAVSVAGPLPEVPVALSSQSRASVAWVTVSPLGDDGGALVHLRPAESGEPASGRARGEISAGGAAAPIRLRIFVLGQTRIERVGADSLAGKWIEQRPGQLLKYLICARGRTVDAHQIAEALWPRGHGGTLSSVRYFVHLLRNRLEPDRDPGEPSSFLISRRGGYAIDLRRVWIDAIEFEQGVASGLAGLVAGERETALARLERASALYRGDFVADEPYAEWALAERDRLRELAARALRALVELQLAVGEVDLAARHARRLADMDPHDSEAQRRHMEISLRRGRRSEAVRRYELFRRRLAKDLNETPDFELADLRGEGEPAGG